MRWPVERTNSWIPKFEHLRRNTDREGSPPLVQFTLAVAFLLTAQLIDWRNRWSPQSSSIGSYRRCCGAKLRLNLETI